MGSIDFLKGLVSTQFLDKAHSRFWQGDSSIEFLGFE
jgi:hypothetical protein